MIPFDDLLARLREANIRLWLEEGEIRYRAPKGAMTPELASQIVEHKQELQRILQAAQTVPIRAAPDLAPRERPAYPPLSFAQERLWFLHQLEGDHPAYNVFKAFSLSGPLDIARLRDSLGEVIARHESLRMTFPDRGGIPYQNISNTNEFPFVLEDLQSLGAAARQRRLEELCLATIREPFNLARGPLLRTTLIQLEAETYILLLAMHHIITDGWSFDVLVREIVRAYEQRAAGSEKKTFPLPLQYTDFTLWQRSWLTQEALTPYIEFWAKDLAGAPEITTLTPDRPRPPEATFDGAMLPLRLDGHLSASIRELGARTGTTAYMIILAAFAALLHRYTQMNDIVIGAPVANRSHVDLEDLIGFFVNSLALRLDLSGDPSFEQLLARVRNKTLMGLSYQDLPFELLVKHLHTERDLSRNPLFQVMFSMREGPGHPSKMAGVEIEAISFDAGVSRFDLNLMLWHSETEIFGHWEYSTDLYQPGTIERFSQHFLRFLKSAVSNPDQRITGIPLLSEDECHFLINEWGAGAEASLPAECVHELFEAQVERTPKAVALEFGGERLSYENLNARANQLARRLQANSIQPDDRVGIYMPRSMDMIIAILGILKAGAAYVPLDPSLPKRRLEYMVEDAGARVILTCTGQDMPALDFDGVEIQVIEPAGTVVADGSQNPGLTANGENLAYVIYTSGSTGKPKGVAMAHRALTNLISWQLDHSFVPSARTLQFTTMGFDVSFQEIMATLAGGGTLVLITEDERQDFRLLGLRLAELEIERIFLPYSALQLLAEVLLQQGTGGIHLKEVITAGEQLRITPVIKQLFTNQDGCVLHNHYGPTEAHAVTAYTLTGDPASWPLLPPIGRPIPNVETYILDRDLKPVPVGVVGELHLGGISLARGYLNRPVENETRFIGHPFSRDPRARLYRTGDLARHLPSGDIRFLGRNDDQIKIRGYRVELGEIEAVLGQHEAVGECAVKLADMRQAEARLWAFIIPKAGSAPGKRRLDSYLKSRLPEYMIPGRYFVVNEIPLTSSGKMDRSALSEEGSQELGASEGYVAPRNPLESQISAVWEQVLGVQPVGANDNFFDLGGHSMLAIQLLAALKQTTGVDLSVAALFQAPTVAQQATMIKERGGKSAGSTLIPIRDGGRGQPIFFVHWAGGSVLIYRELIHLLDPDHRVYGLQAYGLDRRVRPHTRIEQMAEHYVAEIQELQPHGPYYLAGASMGGSIAYEMARQLEAQREPVGLVALFDAVGRPNLGALPFRERVQLHAGNIRERPSQSALSYLFERTIIRVRRMLFAMVIGLGIPLPRFMWNLRETTYYAFKHYQPRGYSGDVVLFRATERGPGSPKSQFLGWEQVVSGGITIIDVPGKHSTLLRDPSVRLVATALDDLLAGAREAPTQPGADLDERDVPDG